MMRKPYYRYRKTLGRLAQFVLTALIAAFCLGPLYWVFITSFKPLEAEYQLPPELWPSKPTLQAYRVILGIPSSEAGVSEGPATGIVFHSPTDTAEDQTYSFLVPLRNSLIVASVVSVFSQLIGSLAA